MRGEIEMDMSAFSGAALGAFCGSAVGIIFVLEFDNIMDALIKRFPQILHDDDEDDWDN